ncbi:MAG: HEAT repeat domain-containing protein [Acidobacteria bacterium]|nr:HEAT repeat domain-containing protein [Acidobacteriota bacterium]
MLHHLICALIVGQNHKDFLSDHDKVKGPMNKYRFLFFLGLVLLLFSICPINAQTYTTSDGHEFSVSVKPEKSTIMLGETTYIVFEVKNNSYKNLYFADGGDYRNNLGRPESYSVTVVRDDGKKVPQPKVTFSMGGLIGTQVVPVNGSYTRKLFLPHWATFEKPGTYNITVERTLGIGEKSVLSLRKPVKEDAPVISSIKTKASTKITVKATDEKALGEVINDLGEKMLSENNKDNARNALMLLDFIKDGRTIEYWIRALDMYSMSSDWDTHQRFRQVPVILAKYDTPEVTGVLETAIKSPSKEVRLDVANALSISSDPKALQLLISMHDDAYWFVRLRVAQALGKLLTEESTEMLVAMLTDREDSVRDSAANSLKARGKMPEYVPLLPMDELACPIRQTSAVKSMQNGDSSGNDITGESNIFSMANCAEALEAFTNEREEHKKTENKFGEGWVLVQLGDIYSKTKRHDSAYEYYLQALPLFLHTNNDAARSVLYDLASTGMLMKNPSVAIEHLNVLLSLTRNHANKNIRSNEGGVLSRLADAYKAAGNTAKQVEYLKLSYDYELKNESLFSISNAARDLAVAYEEIGQRKEALHFYRKALESKEKAVSKSGSSWLVIPENKADEEIKKLKEAIARLEQ